MSFSPTVAVTVTVVEVANSSENVSGLASVICGDCSLGRSEGNRGKMLKRIEILLGHAFVNGLILLLSFEPKSN